MADQGEAKTKTIGFLPIEKVQTLPGWDEYVDKSSKLAALRTETQKAKNSVREALKQRLDENNEIDFRVFRKLYQGRRTTDLSSSFREQPFSGSLEPSGVTDQAEEPNNLDPVTERLLAMLKEKAQR